MTLLHTIYADGRVQSAHYTGPLQFDAPPSRHLAQIIGGDCLIEHVNVLWQGRLCHMFVDDMGHRKSLPANPKATRIYWNATWQHMGKPEMMYSDLEASERLAVPLEELESEVRSELLSAPTIVGIALLWEGSYT